MSFLHIFSTNNMQYVGGEGGPKTLKMCLQNMEHLHGSVSCDAICRLTNQFVQGQATKPTMNSTR